MVKGNSSLDPRNYPSETFDLFSIPAFDLGRPEVTRGAEIGSTKQVVMPDDILISKIVPHIRRAWIVGANRGRRQIASGEWIVFRSERVFPGYLRHALVSDGFHSQFMQTVSGVGGSLLRARPAYVTNIEIPFPPLPEQRRIAEVLDRAETLRAQRRQALAQLDALAEAIFLDMFIDPRSERWVRTSIGELAATMRTGPFGSQLLHSEFVESGVAVLGIDNVVKNEFVWAQPRYITDAKFKQLERYRVVAGDVLITIMGTCGRCAIVPDDVPVAINTKHLCCIRLDMSRCLPSYLQAALLLHPEVLFRLGVHERGAVMPGLNMQIIRELEIPLPPLAVQRQFEDEMRLVARETKVMAASLAELDALFASLQHRAFRGEL